MEIFIPFLDELPVIAAFIILGALVTVQGYLIYIFWRYSFTTRDMFEKDRGIISIKDEYLPGYNPSFGEIVVRNITALFVAQAFILSFRWIIDIFKFLKRR